MAEKGVEEQVLAMERLRFSTKSNPDFYDRPGRTILNKKAE